MEDFTEEEIQMIQRRMETECKVHNWFELEDKGVFECMCCSTLLFDKDADITVELLEKYLLEGSTEL